jgi:hypothetical protein
MNNPKAFIPQFHATPPHQKQADDEACPFFLVSQPAI